MDGKKKEFGVCVKYLSALNDKSIKLAEWFESLRAFGATKVYYPYFEAHPNILNKVKFVCSKNKEFLTFLFQGVPSL